MTDNDALVNVEVEIPQYGIEINDGPDGSPSFYSLNIMVSGGLVKFYLCEAGQGQAVARGFTQKLNQADTTTRKRKHGGLIVPNGVSTNGLRTTEGR